MLSERKVCHSRVLAGQTPSGFAVPCEINHGEFAFRHVISPFLRPFHPRGGYNFSRPRHCPPPQIQAIPPWTIAAVVEPQDSGLCLVRQESLRQLGLPT